MHKDVGSPTAHDSTSIARKLSADHFTTSGSSA
jgi:hypothetical protein